MRPVVANFVASALLLAGACHSTNHSPVPPGGQPDGGGSQDAGSMHADAGKPPVQHDDAATPESDAGQSGDDAGMPDAGGGPKPVTKTSLIWVWLGYADALNAIADHRKSFTHVSPALYNLNFDYQSGPPHMVNENDDYDGLSSQEIAQKVHDAGLKVVPLMYAGSGNFGTDQGIQNVLNDTNGAQQNFIDALVEEGMSKGYDGWNLDWEVNGDTNYDQYGQKLIDFLGKLKSALNSKNMILTFDAAGWYTKQCNGSGGGGLVDLAAMGEVVDLAIFEAYSGALGSPSSCEGAGEGGFDCDGNFAEALNALCGSKRDAVSVGLISPGSNGFASDALQAADTYGYKSVSVWPDDQEFLKADGMPDGATWYSVLEDFLSR